MIAVLKTIITRSFVRFVVVLNLKYSNELTLAESEIGLDYLFCVLLFFLASRESWNPFSYRDVVCTKYFWGRISTDLKEIYPNHSYRHEILQSPRSAMFTLSLVGVAVGQSVVLGM